MPLLRAYPNRIAQFRQVPRGTVRVDVTNPLSRALVGAYLPGISAGRNIAQPGFHDLTSIGTSPNQTGGTPKYKNTAEGPSWHTANSPDGLSGLTPSSIKSATTITLYWRGLVTSPGNVLLWGQETANSEASPFVVYALGTSGTTEFLTAWSSGATEFTGTPFATTWPMFAGVGGTFKVGGNAKLYVNGRLRDTTSFGASGPTTTATTTSCIQTGTFTGTRANTLDCVMALTWLRELSASEMADLDANPYQIFVPAGAPLAAQVITPRVDDYFNFRPSRRTQ